VQIRDPRSGQVVLNRVLRPGESFAVPREGLVMTTGKAQGLELVVDGQPTQALAGRVGVVRDVALSPDQLRALRPGAGATPGTTPAR
jgi:cytoskeleton protein RodZ